MNWQDLNILRQNLAPAGFTLSQFAQSAIFGQLSYRIRGAVAGIRRLRRDLRRQPAAHRRRPGTVNVNTNSRGSRSSWPGRAMPRGSGSAPIPRPPFSLNGQYSRFESTIGVDGTSNSGSSVIFAVYGDDQLLYQSPALTYASGGIPIDVNVAGVSSLKLVVSPAPGSTASGDHGVWADARLVSTANFGSTTPYSLTWQLSQNGTVMSTQTTDSFDFAALSGTYTIALTVTDAQGDTGHGQYPGDGRTQRRVGRVRRITTTPRRSGDWLGVYGTQGYDVAGASSAIPSYANVTVSGATLANWAASTTDPRALQVSPGGIGARPANAWLSSSSFSVDVNLTDGQSHDLTLYFLDWYEKAAARACRSPPPPRGRCWYSETMSNFNGGIYQQFVVSGDVIITFTAKGGYNALLSGLFFDPPTTVTTASAIPVNKDGTTSGNWVGAYGTQGYEVVGTTSDYPSYATVTVTGAGLTNWAASTTDPRGLEVPPSGPGRTANAWVSSSSFSVNVNLTDGQSHDLALYFLDWPLGPQRGHPDHQRQHGCGAVQRDDVELQRGDLPAVYGQR